LYSIAAGIVVDGDCQINQCGHMQVLNIGCR
jgi:hypothetical protein